MALAPRLDLRQSQSLVMTPQLQQAIKLLTLSNLELETFISDEIEKNPLLDTGDISTESGEVSENENGPSEAAAQGSDEILSTGPAESESTLDMQGDTDSFSNNSLSDSDGALDGQLGLNGSSSGSGAAASGEAPDFENMLVAEITLTDHLMDQAGAVLSGMDLFVAQHIIDQIDECGYLQADLLELAQRLNVGLVDVERILDSVQTLDPVGVGARDLAECLALQAKDADRYDPAMERLIDNLDLLAKGALPQLKRICGVDNEDLMDMISELRNYDPKPGCKIGGGAVQAVVPDVFIAERAGRWIIEVNSATLPKVLVNRTYYSELKDGAQDKESKDWLNECLADANWLVKALDQRQRTIVKVATEIVKQQEEFFRKGVAHLRPLTLRHIAEKIEMHESTVSRVTSNKYLSCSRGTFELKYFFTSGIQSSTGGEAASAEAVKSHIKALIDDEDPKKILSDDKLVTLLQAKGFDIARRTVAKYREALGMGSSVQRRRQKALEGKAA
ncbi:RNA polymerase factor sigma-54 [Parasphingorhabdus flavimaris]|uniref:RNA polymerase sigma-54 factor n=1 Tax=Parasphingorhabdus flavimaris TaxID=266812 RepID=A0ABX2N5P9_9SPHN|nr:RNA polymerase factor sigma-54 [Parasphingorhabdus flavimaris]NVD28856.1 RNA polymerase factor sigma-54 [Parasphingorhabdus flavimaris]|tara:strand:+ start:20363 stop:21877 length:1515 start_codon:yes stop_codon:yes gene_type:complete